MLLYSNILIYAARGEYRHLFDFILANDVSVSAICRIEVLGYPCLTREDENAFENMFRTFKVYPVDEPVIDEALRLRRLKSMSLGDCIIAGTAMCHGLPLATRNMKDFDWIEQLVLYNPVDNK